jgi:mono/diheme cytochrome c family protein
MMKFLLGLVVGVCLIPACVYAYLRLGFAPVATAAPPMLFEKRMARMALHTRIAKEAPAEAPLAASEDNLAAGARIYREHCAYCHGIAGQAETASPKGMFPHPPQLFKGKGVTDDPAGEIYWKTANGIRLTGMPGYRKTLTEDQLWQVSLMLLNAGKLPPAVKELVAKPAQ